MQITTEEKRACLKRELSFRRRVYRRRVEEGRMTQQEAEKEIAVMEAILADYQTGDLFK